MQTCTKDWKLWNTSTDSLGLQVIDNILLSCHWWQKESWQLHAQMALVHFIQFHTNNGSNRTRWRVTWLWFVSSYYLADVSAMSSIDPYTSPIARFLIKKERQKINWSEHCWCCRKVCNRKNLDNSVHMKWQSRSTLFEVHANYVEKPMVKLAKPDFNWVQ